MVTVACMDPFNIRRNIQKVKKDYVSKYQSNSVIVDSIIYM